MIEVIEIPPGEYLIGNESIPNGGPQHRRRFHGSVWMDARPVSWEHFESFVEGGGYTLEVLEGRTVDERTRQLIEQSIEIRAQNDRFVPSTLLQPITGLSWFEAVRLVAFYGARLPYEIEWEIANTGIKKSIERVTDDVLPAGLRSRMGFSVYVGSLQEWTLDAFSTKYWRADFDKRGIPWKRDRDGTGVTIRGAGPEDLFRHVCYRFASAPNQTHPYRGFRRVWESKPADAEVAPEWRSS